MIKKSLSDTFIRNNIIFFAGSMAVAVLNYLYHPILSRLLSVQSFGDVEALISLLSQIGILGGIFGKIVINRIANTEDTAQQRVIISEIYTSALIILGMISGLMLLLSKFVTDVFHFQSNTSIIILALMILLSIPFTLQTSILQGVKNFKRTAFVNILSSAAKLLCAVILVLLGFGVPGAIIALLLAQLIPIIITHSHTKSYFSFFTFRKPTRSLIRKEFVYGLLILCTTGFITILYTSDIIVVKHFFPSESAGLYSGISTIANILFFVTASIAGVLLPSVSKHHTFRENNKHC